MIADDLGAGLDQDSFAAIRLILTNSLPVTARKWVF
jgi:hypothetical protein